MKLQYGLNVPAVKKQEKQKPKQITLFSADEQQESLPFNQMLQQDLDAIHEMKVKKSQKEIDKILESDPYALGYDDVIEDIHRTRNIQTENQDNKKAKYVSKLVANAKRKEVEREVVEQRKLHKELEKEEIVYGDAKKYITPEYEKLLKETKRFAEEEKLNEEREKTKS